METMKADNIGQIHSWTASIAHAIILTNESAEMAR